MVRKLVTELLNWTRRAVSLGDMVDVARELVAFVKPDSVIYFYGELGTGKTTLIQQLFQELQVGDSVLSPTFSVLKPYTAASGLELLHVDLYRIENPAELLLIGIDDFMDSGCAWFVEWPQRGMNVIPPADVCVELSHAGSTRNIRAKSYISPQTFSCA